MIESNKHFESTLPEGYSLAYVFDAQNKKLGLLMNLAALGITLVFAVAGFFWFKPEFSFGDRQLMKPLLLWMLLLVGHLAIHELLHGLAYKLLTRQKLRFGLTLTVAFCGVPQIYVYRTCAIIALLTPFAVLNSVFILAVALAENALWRFLFFLLLGLHTGGCIGDLSGTYLYLTRFKDKTTLMQDTGPKQSFYVKSDM